MKLLNFKKQKILITFIVFVLGCVIVGCMWYFTHKNAEERYATKAQLYAQINAGVYEENLTQQVTVLMVLEEVIVSSDGTISNFEDVAERLMADNVKNISVAPGGVSTMVYPADEKKEGDINLLEDDKSRSLAEYCVENADDIAISGPYEESDADGETVIVTQKAVELDDEFWGFVMVVVDVESLIRSTSESLKDCGYEYCLTKNIEPGVDDTIVVASSQDESYFEDGQSHSFTLGGCDWELKVKPTRNWSDYFGATMVAVFGSLIVVLITILVYVLLSLIEYGRRQSRMTRTDYLTGLNNRQGLRNDIDKFLDGYPENPYTLMSLDVDDFKTINDRFGHQNGDKVLKQLAKNLKRAFPEDAVLGRNGGDEFLIFLPNLDAEAAEPYIRAFSELEQSYRSGEIVIPFNVSMGYADFPVQSDDIDELLKFSDAALYDVKEHGKRSYARYKG